MEESDGFTDGRLTTCIVVDASGSYMFTAGKLLPLVAESLNQDIVYVYFSDTSGVHKRALSSDELRTAGIVDEDGFKNFPKQVGGGGDGVQAGITAAQDDGFSSMVILTDGYFLKRS